MWPFKRRQPEELSATELRDRLIAAASSKRKLRALCEQYKAQVAENVDLMCRAPEAFEANPAAVHRYVQCLGTVAHCLATQCDAPELWNRLCGTPEDNPLLQWDRWYRELPERMERLEYDELIAEAKAFIEQAKSLQGHAARQNEAFLQGRLGELLFHSGSASDAVEAWQSALELCREINDVEGQFIYLGNLLEVFRYVGDSSAAIAFGEESIELLAQHKKDAAHVMKSVQRLRQGEPLCRVVCVRDSREWELDELSDITDGKYEFQFRRNRLSLQKSTRLVARGNELASNGQLADALEKYQEAMEVDSYDPDPLYQSGTCLLELGAYGKAREAFEDVERIAPGWFRCRSDIWLAESLENGTVSDEEFRLLRALEDGGLNASESMQIARQAIERYPDFAPFRLALGDLQRDENDRDAAIASYRVGLELVKEPDLESRLLCALAGALSKEPSERTVADWACALPQRESRRSGVGKTHGHSVAIHTQWKDSYGTCLQCTSRSPSCRSSSSSAPAARAGEA